MSKNYVEKLNLPPKIKTEIKGYLDSDNPSASSTDGIDVTSSDNNNNNNNNNTFVENSVSLVKGSQKLDENTFSEDAMNFLRYGNAEHQGKDYGNAEHQGKDYGNAEHQGKDYGNEPLTPLNTRKSGKIPDTSSAVRNLSASMNMQFTELTAAVSELMKEPLCERKKNLLNLKIQCFLKRKGITVGLPTIRKAVTWSIGDAQQMTDMWGKSVADYAKGSDATCYLCGKKIFPFASCPEMEHKLPVTTAYSSLTHYRRLQGYEGDRNGNTMYDLWKNFVNNDNLLRLYQLINEQQPYNKDAVNSLYDRIFVSFWASTKYRDYIPNIGSVTNSDQLSFDNDYYKNVYYFFYYFIKCWLFEFAYSHHTCNQSKSDLYIYNTVQQSNTMVKDAARRIRSNVSVPPSDMKTASETTTFGPANNHKEDMKIQRTNMGLPMYDHFIRTIDNYYKYYNPIAARGMFPGIPGYKDYIENADRLAEKLVMIKALHLVMRENRHQGKKPEDVEKTRVPLIEEINKLLDQAKEIEENLLEINSLRSVRVKEKQSSTNEEEIKNVKSQLNHKLAALTNTFNTIDNLSNGIVNNQGDGDSNQKESAIVSEESAIVSEESAVASLTKFKEVVEGYQTRYGENPINCAFDCDYYSLEKGLVGSTGVHPKRNDSSQMQAVLHPIPPPLNSGLNKGGKRVKCKTKKKRKTKKKGTLVPKQKRRTKRKK